jgi:hypothetical protein
MIAGSSGPIRAISARDHEIGVWRPGQDRALGGELGAQAAGPAAGGRSQRVEAVGETALPPGQPGGQHRAGRVGFGQPLQGSGRGVGLVHGQGEGGQPARRAVQAGQRPGAVARAPRHGGAAVRTGEPETPAQRRGQYSLGQDHGTDRVRGHVPPGNRGCEHEGARRRVQVVEAGARPAQGGRHHGR